MQRKGLIHGLEGFDNIDSKKESSCNTNMITFPLN
jgi:hypothetical protein